jgi:phthiocerol/phenolphthiocerol synthesis type-I polyketide synthase E
VTSGSSVFNPIAGIGPGEAAAQFRPKVEGVYVLERLLGGKDLDFVIMTSSNSSVLGGMGFVAYSAANAFMDSFASSSTRRGGPPWISSSWDPWPEETKKYTGVQTSMDKYAMTPPESVEAFTRATTQVEDGHVVVATGDLDERLSLWIRRDYSAAATAETHARPDLQGEYVAPENETEQAIADIWQQLLGIERVGTRTNFFDLGGHSLLATRLVARLGEQFQVDFPLQSFFAAPTIAGLAQEVTKIQEAAESKEKAELLELLAPLSDEEVEMELRRRANQQGMAD